MGYTARVTMVIMIVCAAAMIVSASWLVRTFRHEQRLTRKAYEKMRISFDALDLLDLPRLDGEDSNHG